MTQAPNRRRKKRRVAAYFGAATILVLLVTTIVLRVGYNGPALAATVESALNNSIRGSIKVESLDWPLKDLTKLLTGGWVHVEVTGLVVKDEYGEVVIDTPGATLEIDVHPAIGGKHFRIRKVRLDRGGRAMLREVPEPYPAHEYDTTVVSLVSAFYPQRAPYFSAGYNAKELATIDLRDFSVGGEGISMDLHFADFNAQIRKLRGGGFLFFGGRDPLAQKFYYSLAPTTHAESATFEIDSIPIVLSDLRLERLSQLPSRWPAELVPRDLKYKLSASSPNGMTVNLEGAILDSWVDIFGGELRLTLEALQAGPLVSAATDDIAGGDNLSLTLDVDGPILAPRLAAQVRALDLRLPLGEARPPLQLHVEQARAEWDLATESGVMEDTIATGAGGEIHLGGHFRLKPLNFDISIEIPKAIEIEQYLPKDVAALAGTQLSGSLYASGTQEIQRLERLDLQLGKATFSGEARKVGGLIHADDVDIILAGTRIENLQGDINIPEDRVDVRFKVVSRDSQRWLRYFKAPQLMKSASGRVRVAGALTAPTASADLVAHGVPIVDRLELVLGYADQVVRINEARTATLGGWIRASGAILLGDNPQLSGVEAEGVNLQLSNLPLIGSVISGTADLKLTAHGSPSRPTINSQLALDGWTIAGESYEDTEVLVETRRNGGRRLATTLQRTDGGELHIDALLDRASQLTGIVSLRELPLDRILAFSTDSEEPIMGGALSAEMQMGGTSAAPTFSGQISLLRSWLKNAFLGTAELDLEPIGNSVVRISGHIFQRRITIDGTLTTKAPYSADLSIGLRRIEIDRFAPELAKQGIRGWVSGTVQYQGSLLGEEDATLRASLNEAEIVVQHENADGRPSPIRLRNRSALELKYEAGRLAFLNEATIHGPTGDFLLSGSGSAEDLDFRFAGGISVSLLEAYMQEQFDEMSGNVVVKGHVSGSLDSPHFAGVLEIDGVRLKPKGQDAIASIPTGKIDVSNDQLSLTGLRIVVNDTYSDDVAELSISGGFSIKDFQPDTWTMNINGKLAGKMLLVLAPEIFSAAAGSAEISVALTGTGDSPIIDGSIDFDNETPLSLTPRAVRRELAFNRGTVFFTDKLVEFEDVEALIDSEALLTVATGSQLSIENWRPSDVDITVSARDLPFRIPNQLDLTLDLVACRLLLDDSMEIEGTIEVTDGRYTRKFNPLLDALQPVHNTSESETPFYHELPLLRDADLDLTIMSRAFFVDNNVAKMELNGEVDISGTPASPRFDGVVRVEQGSFKFQGIRDRFERTTGSVRFSSLLEFPDETPFITIDSESDYRDLEGRDHLVQLRIRGPLSKLDVDLSTAAGLNKAQALQLILAGRTPDDVRAAVGDEAVGRRPGDFEGARSTATSDGTLQALDQVTKDLAADWFSLIIGDRLRDVTNLDVARLQVGTATIGFYGEKDLTRSLKLIGEVERSLQGWTWDLRGRYQLNDEWSVDSEYLVKSFDDEAAEDVSQLRIFGTKTVKLNSWRDTWRFFIP